MNSKEATEHGKQSHQKSNPPPTKEREKKHSNGERLPKLFYFRVRKIKRMNNKYYDTFYGHKVSEYALENGFLDYATLSKCFDCVLCNLITEVDETLFDNLESGELFEYTDSNGDYLTREEYEQKEEQGEEVFENMVDIFQFFIVDDSALYLLKEANEIVFYSEKLDCYIWGITHCGTSWAYVLTSIKLREKESESAKNE